MALGARAARWAVAAIACAVADAIAPFGTVDRLPLLPGTVWTALQAAAD